MLATQFPTKAAALAAIAAYVATGKATRGHAEMRFAGGRAYYTAHVQDGAASWALKAWF